MHEHFKKAPFKKKAYPVQRILTINLPYDKLFLPVFFGKNQKYKKSTSHKGLKLTNPSAYRLYGWQQVPDDYAQPPCFLAKARTGAFITLKVR